MRPYAFLVLNWCFWEQKPLAPGWSTDVLEATSGVYVDFWWNDET